MNVEEFYCNGGFNLQFSIGVEYAFHSLFYMVNLPQGVTIGIKELAKLNSISETYLSKIFTKLRKGGIVRSVPGVNGGYELSRLAKDISFWDIVESVEGSSSIFQCAEIRQNNIFSKGEDYSKACPCLIKVVMSEAEEQMRNYLREKSLEWLYKTVYGDMSEKKKDNVEDWLNRAVGKSNV